MLPAVHGHHSRVSQAQRGHRADAASAAAPPPPYLVAPVHRQESARVALAARRREHGRAHFYQILTLSLFWDTKIPLKNRISGTKL